MSTSVSATREKSQTTVNTSKKLFSGGEHGFRNAAVVTNLDTSTAALKIRCVPRGAAAPADITSGQETYKIYAGDSFNLGQAGDASNDIYVWGDGGVVVDYVAQEIA
jgi:hypothetical protein